ncbi:hypothetical protein VTK73DRAFT_1545 [Phialemonium thermophilum]|uniref:SRR1-like domain-containing protein n=1 Tax=Phialemonium thermophilum TaxID=223376 RepID=A0ABR3VT89_9PEZI
MSTIGGTISVDSSSPQVGTTPWPADEDEPWIPVVRRKKQSKDPRRSRRSGAARAASSRLDGEEQQRQFETPPNPSPQLTLEQIARRHDRISTEWRAGACCAQLRSLVEKSLPSHVRLTRAVCLGIGSFEPVESVPMVARVAHVQLEAFRVMAELLEAHCGAPVQRIIQEPCFSPTDKQFCESLGFRVVDTPTAFDMIDGETLLYGIHLYIPTWAQALRKQLPGCWVGCRVDDCERYRDLQNQDIDIARIQAIDDTFDKMPFPQEKKGDFTFSDTVVYWAQR